MFSLCIFVRVCAAGRQHVPICIREARLSSRLCRSASAHTRLRSATARHGDESHAPLSHISWCLFRSAWCFASLTHVCAASAGACLRRRFKGRRSFHSFPSRALHSWGFIGAPRLEVELWWSRRTLRQPLYVYNAGTEGVCDISKFVPLCSRQNAATQ